MVFSSGSHDGFHCLPQYRNKGLFQLVEFRSDLHEGRPSQKERETETRFELGVGLSIFPTCLEPEVPGFMPICSPIVFRR